VRGAKGGNGIGDGVNGTVKAARCSRDEHGVDVEVLMKGGAVAACKEREWEGGLRRSESIGELESPASDCCGPFSN
jgi:hypothetical protein